MSYVNIHEAKTHLSRYVEAVESGAETEVIIARNGKPAARLVPIENVLVRRRLGQAKGKFNFDCNRFQALDAEIEKLFNESADPYGERLKP
jgi:prevent-host-death family protein